jgi:hypothetical protein
MITQYGCVLASSFICRKKGGQAVAKCWIDWSTSAFIGSVGKSAAIHRRTHTGRSEEERDNVLGYLGGR